jgi:hypothetical protein
MKRYFVFNRTKKLGLYVAGVYTIRGLAAGVGRDRGMVVADEDQLTPEQAEAVRKHDREQAEFFASIDR